VFLVADFVNSNSWVFVNPGTNDFATMMSQIPAVQSIGYGCNYCPGASPEGWKSVTLGQYSQCSNKVEAGYMISRVAASTNYADVYNFLTQVPNSWINVSSGKWEIAGNWSAGVAPSITDLADVIANASNKTVTIDATTALSNTVNGCMIISNLTVSAPLGATNMLFLNNAGTATPLSILDALTIGTNGTVVVGNQSVVQAFSNLLVGVGGGTGALTITPSGTVTVTNASANAVLEVRSGTLSLDGGTVTVNQLVLTNGANSQFAFPAGALSSGGTFVTNNQVFVVGDGTDAATYHLLGGVHNFANNLEIRNNASLTGCGTINGNVLVDAGGTVQANCGSTLDFNGTVTNNSSVVALNGTTVNFYGPVVNNGTIDGTSGGVHFYSTLRNNGVVMGVTNSWIDGSAKWETATNWWLGTAPSSSDAADLITNAGNNTVTIDATTAGSFPGTMTIRNLTVSAPGVATNMLFLNNVGTNTPLRVLGVLTLGTNGAMVVNNSAAQSTNSVSIGSASSSLTVTNGGSLVVTNGNRTGSVVVNGGSLILGTGTFKTDNLIVTNGGTVQNTQTNQVDNESATVDGGSLVATNAPTTIGSVSNSVASLSVSSNATVLTSLTTLAAGTNATASLTVQNTATMQVLSNLTAGSGVGATATVSIVGGQLTATNGVIGIGNDGTATNGFGVGTMTVSNGTVLANRILLGSSAGGQGQLTVQSNGLVSLVGTGAFVACNDLICDGGTLEIGNGVIYCGYQQPGAMTMSSGAASCELLEVGVNSQGTLTVLSGQMTISSTLDIGSTAAGSVWMSGGQLTANGNTTTIGDQEAGQFNLSGGTVQVSTLVVGTSGAPGGVGTLTVAGGALTANAGLIVGTGTVWVSNSGQLLVPSSLVIGSNGIGQLTISSGLVQANSLVLTNGAQSQIALVGGVLNSGGTVVTNGQNFLVGNGSSAATFAMGGGTHWFGNGLEIANKATLTGCGVINGAVTVDAGAHAVATCGALTFSNNVTINGNGVVRVSNGSVVNFAGPVVNNGAIDALNGPVNFSSPPTGTGYVLTSGCVPVITAIQRVGPDIHISFTTSNGVPYAVSYKTDMVTGTWTPLTNVTGTGGTNTVVDSGATLQPQRFYQVNLVVPL
jgi:filamentous hemagglutinin